MPLEYGLGGKCATAVLWFRCSAGQAGGCSLARVVCFVWLRAVWTVNVPFVCKHRSPGATVVGVLLYMFISVWAGLLSWLCRLPKRPSRCLGAAAARLFSSSRAPCTNPAPPLWRRTRRRNGDERARRKRTRLIATWLHILRRRESRMWRLHTSDWSSVRGWRGVALAVEKRFLRPPALRAACGPFCSLLCACSVVNCV